MSDVKSFGKFAPLFGRCTVRLLLIAIVKNPPMIDRVAKADCGTSLPNMIVAPMKGAVNNHTRAQTTVENAQIFFFSLHTSSVVHVVKMDRVDEMATFDTIADTMSNTTRWSPLTGGGEWILLCSMA